MSTVIRWVFAFVLTFGIAIAQTTATQPATKRPDWSDTGSVTTAARIRFLKDPILANPRIPTLDHYRTVLANLEHQDYGKLPISFEPNLGQADPEVKFLARTGNATIFFTAKEAVLSLVESGLKDAPMHLTKRSVSFRHPAGHNAFVKIKFVDSRVETQIVGENELPGKNNYIVGNDRKKWKRNIPTYGRITYRGIYPGIDLTFYTAAGRLEYDFNIAPGADPDAIRLAFQGVTQINLDGEGDLALQTEAGQVLQRHAAAYQTSKGVQRPIASEYTLLGRNEVGFRLGPYDRSESVKIDPVLVFSTYFTGRTQSHRN